MSLAWLLPGSPVTMWRADDALTVGDPERAAALYDEVADAGWWASLRLSALDRSASVHADRLRDAEGARVRLERLLAVAVDPEIRADLRERIAWSQADVGAAASAASAFVAAADAAPESDRAAERLILAARYLQAADSVDQAGQMWERIRQDHPAHSAQAELALGRLALSSGDAQEALARFEASAESGERADIVIAARLGAATALERLGSLDGAIAEIDELDLPEGVAESRLDALRSRREARER